MWRMRFSTLWRRDLADERRRYLIQQMELGGGEVILEARAPAVEKGAASSPSLADAAPIAPAGEAEPKWKKGAPPIPGPGLVIEPPVPTLLGGDPLAELESLDAIAERIRTTRCCGLCEHRTHAVPGEGNARAKMVFVGEGPGATEDATGRPFVGQAGKMLEVRKSLGDLRGKVHSYGGIPLVVTYHPAALLRNPNWKKPTWDDVRIA